MNALPITVFFDFTCPFSYVTVAALHRRAAAGGVEVIGRALELFPVPEPLRPPTEDPKWEAEVRPRAEALGLALRVPAFRPRTRKAHEAVLFAGERGLAGEMREAIFAAFWGEERDIGRIDVLTSLAGELGMDAEELRIALDIDRHREAVLRDQAVAERLRVVVTPTLFVGSGPAARILVGAQGPEELEKAVTNFEF